MGHNSLHYHSNVPKSKATFPEVVLLTNFPVTVHCLSSVMNNLSYSSHNILIRPNIHFQTHMPTVVFPQPEHLATQRNERYCPLTTHPSACQAQTCHGNIICLDYIPLTFVTLQSLRGGQVANNSTSALFIQHGKYPQVTHVCQVYKSWEHG